MFVLLYTLLCVHSSFAIILKRKRKRSALLLLCVICIVTINVMWLFPTVPWVGLQCVIVVFPDHTHLLFIIICIEKYKVPAYTGTGDNVDTFLSNILKLFKIYFNLTLSPGQIWSYLFVAKKPFK